MAVKNVTSGSSLQVINVRMRTSPHGKRRSVKTRKKIGGGHAPAPPSSANPRVSERKRAISIGRAEPKLSPNRPQQRPNGASSAPMDGKGRRLRRTPTVLAPRPPIRYALLMRDPTPEQHDAISRR